VVAGVVRRALELGKPLSGLTRAELAEQSPLLDDEFYALLRDGAWLETKVSEGGTSLARVREQLQRARAELG
jgi:argininosuccinate lyase